MEFVGAIVTMKLHLVCGRNIISNWDNIDAQMEDGKINFSQICPLPYKNNSIDLIYAEHLIERLTREQAFQLLIECRRVLKPKGIIRISTPDLRTIARDYLEGRTDRWKSMGFSPLNPSQFINESMRSWNHNYIYDWNDLEYLFSQAKYSNISRKPRGISNTKSLSNLESYPDFGDLIIEATKASKSEAPLVSVVMASYNHSKFIRKAIDSVLEQSLSNIELCITDDCSSDDSAAIVESYKDPRIKFLALPKNMGACFAINNAIRRSNAPFISVISSDDFFQSDKLEKQYKIISNNEKIGAVFTHVNFVDENNENINYKSGVSLGSFNQPNMPRQEWLFKLWYTGNYLCHPSAMVRRECYLKEGLYDERFRQIPDYLMWIKILKTWDIFILGEQLTNFRHIEGLGNESAPRPEVTNRCLWEGIYTAREFMSFSDADCDYITKKIMGENSTELLANNSREILFSKIAHASGRVNFIEAAIDVLYAYSATKGEGRDLQNLKLPSEFATRYLHLGIKLGY